MSEFLDCNNKNYTEDELIAALITKDAEGNWALRTMEVTACANDAIDCDTKNLTRFDILKRIVGLNECGKPAIRLAIGTEGA